MSIGNIFDQNIDYNVMVRHNTVMKRIRIADAKAHLSELISGLLPGEDVLITRHGVAVAKVSRVIDSDIIVGQDIAARIRANARELKAGRFTDAELVELAQQGRR